MNNEKLMHDFIVERMKKKFSSEYKEIKINTEGSPDIVLANHGITIAIIEVETEKSITPDKAEKWKDMTQSGSKLILMIPKNSKVKAMELLWQKGIADKVSVGSYEILINMP